MGRTKLVKRTARKHFLERYGSEKILSELSQEDYKLLTTKTRRCYSENNTAVEEVKELRFSVAQVEALTNASQELVLDLYKKFATENGFPELIDQVKNKTSIIESTTCEADITPLDDDPEIRKRFRQQTSQDRHLNLLRNGPTIHRIDSGGVEKNLELETTKPLRTKELYVSSVLPSFSSNDDTHTEAGSSHGLKSVYSASSEGSKRSQGSLHSLSTSHGSPQSQATSQGSKLSNRSDSNNSDTNSKKDNTLDPADDGFSIQA
ncbi:hypothetical protein HPULCUR_005289 [Helicostylum pulchrum]|uniref:Uncharacterized protein n=1 Tax=Helicostylum pulchrum TaxID=562976 RepID=A0ABP9Y003_9FUNG